MVSDIELQNQFATLQIRNEILDVLKGVRFALDELQSNVKSECINCLEAKRKARDHQIRYKAEQIAIRKSNLEF